MNNTSTINGICKVLNEKYKHLSFPKVFAQLPRKEEDKVMSDNGEVELTVADVTHTSITVYKDMSSSKQSSQAPCIIVYLK